MPSVWVLPADCKYPMLGGGAQKQSSAIVEQPCDDVRKDDSRDTPWKRMEPS
jgi:hypothetical protein